MSLRKTQFVCFDCSKKFWVKFSAFADFYEFCQADPDQAPLVPCFYCGEGDAYPLNYINPFDYHFRAQKLGLCPDCGNHFNWDILVRKLPEQIFSNS